MIKLIYPHFWQKRSYIAYLLLPFGMIYYIFSKLRRFFVKKVKFNTKVICIGNYTVGGTGKTQVAKWLAQKLHERHVSFAIISRGYKGSYTENVIVNSEQDSEVVGDEAIELSDHGTVIVSRKMSSSIDLLSRIDPDIVIVDDRLQDDSFFKDKSILVIDGKRGFGNGFPIPAGPVREYSNNYSNICAAVVIDGDVERFRYLQLPLFHASIEPITRFDINDQYYAFAGIGNTQRFFKSLKKAGLKCIKTVSFQDHHRYSTYEVDMMIDEANRLGAKLITTMKDYVKLSRFSKSILCFDVRLVVDNEEKLLECLI